MVSAYATTLPWRFRLCGSADWCRSHAQYKGDDIPGFLGPQSGTQAPPGLYLGNVVWVYPTNTVKDNNGNTVGQQRAQLTSTASSW
jgi:hypothetical protein